ncbi:hypothetical protein O181_101553 [Austropuccinia psidii MF-1]|uniref:Uncharacterized protein n=1 Tax=Austropuccinia psidii MF-1 TaxID=1389203 RepID=A0A9Q3JGS1_9BASI|nr:hypothetical protein [Austropuccinia psidii MF-1]
MLSANDPFINNYGLRNTKQRSSIIEHPSKETKKSLPRTSETSPKEMETPLKRKTNIPRVYIEDEEGTVEKTITITKYKKPQYLKEEDEVNSEIKENNYGK